MKRLIAALALASALVAGVGAQEAAGVGSAPRFGAYLGGCIGFFTVGAVAGASVASPSGWAAGADLACIVPSGADPVAGLTGGRPLRAAFGLSGGWDGPADAPFALSLRLVLAVEATRLSERIVDPVHGIDQSYSTFDLVVDPSFRVAASWFPWPSYGLRAGLDLSLTDLRKSLLSLGAALR